jgi:hypothetical protein
VPKNSKKIEEKNEVMGVFGFRVVFGKNGKSGVFGWPAVGGLVGERPAVMFWWWGRWLWVVGVGDIWI